MSTDDLTPFRRSVYALLATVALAGVAARILSAQLLYEPSLHHPDPRQSARFALLSLAPSHPLAAGPMAVIAAEGVKRSSRGWPGQAPQPMPTFSSNDRSRWATARALVEHGTFVIGTRTPDPSAPEGYRDEGITFEDGWQSVDRVYQADTQSFYSSKPPLLTMIVAGEYWLLKRLFGWSLTHDRWQVVRTVLLTVNLLPFAIYLAVLAGLLDRYVRTEWARLFLFAAACFGTYLTTFAISLNNHTPAAVCALFAVAPVLSTLADGRGWRPGPVSLGQLAVAGFFAGLTFTLELPALALVAGLGGFLLLRRPLATLAVYLPAAAVPAAVLVYVNHLAIGSWTPAYEKFGTDWYRYPGSHWGGWGAALKVGIDFAYEPDGTYWFHWLIGHHGLFSLTPIWLLSAVGLLMGLAAGLYRPRKGRPGLMEEPPPPTVPPWFCLLTLVISVVVVVFYVHWIDHTRNYGGWTSGPRWVFWLTPLWLLAAVPAADALARTVTGRWFAYLLLGVSAFSSAYPAINPWRHPWLMQLGQWQGWVSY